MHGDRCRNVGIYLALFGMSLFYIIQILVSRSFSIGSGSHERIFVYEIWAAVLKSKDLWICGDKWNLNQAIWLGAYFTLIWAYMLLENKVKLESQLILPEHTYSMYDCETEVWHPQPLVQTSAEQNRNQKWYIYSHSVTPAATAMGAGWKESSLRGSVWKFFWK